MGSIGDLGGLLAAGKMEFGGNYSGFWDFIEFLKKFCSIFLEHFFQFFHLFYNFL
jgi:hypothetical protein